MILCLYGEDDYRREHKKNALVTEFKKRHSGIAVEYFDLALPERNIAFKEFLRSQSIFGAAKLAVLEGLFVGKTAEELADEVKASLKQQGTTVIISERDKPAEAFNFLLKKPAISQRFDYLTSTAWIKFLASEADRLGVSLDGDALRFLAAIYEGNTWGAVTELQRIRDLKQASIKKKDLEELGLEPGYNYWSTLNGLKNKEAAHRLAALGRIVALGEPAAKTFNILAAQWRERAADMAEYDLKVKSGKLEYEEALLVLVL